MIALPFSISMRGNRKFNSSWQLVPKFGFIFQIVYLFFNVGKAVRNDEDADNAAFEYKKC
jgi:hypothetical protein